MINRKMKRYPLIAGIIFCVSGFSFSVQAQNPVNPVDAAQRKAVDDFRILTDAMRARAEELKEAEFEKIKASGEYDAATLAVIKQTMDAGTNAGLVVMFREASTMCMRIGDGVRKCDVTPEGRKAMADMVHQVALAAAARGEGRIGDITDMAKAYAAQKIAANHAAAYAKVTADALQKIRLGDHMLRGGLSEAQMKLFATNWLVNSPLNFFGLGKSEWNAGNVAVIVGKQGQPLLREIQEWTEQINALIAGAQAGMRRGDGSYTEGDLKRDMESVQTLLSNIRNNSEIILSLVYKDPKTGELTDAMRNLAMTNADAAKALRAYGPVVIAAVDSVNEGMKKMKSAEVQAQLEMLGKLLNTKVDINKPFEEQVPELDPSLPATGAGGSAGAGSGSAPKPPAAPAPAPTVTMHPATGQPVRYVFNGRDFVPMPANAPLPPLYDVTEITVGGRKIWAVVPRN